jgi:hypothetical protein
LHNSRYHETRGHLLPFIISFHFSPVHSIPQDYHSLVVENAQWQVIWTPDSPHSWPDKTGWLLRGDTVINGTHYKKLYHRHFENEHSNVIDQEYLCSYLREVVSERKVYHLDTGSYWCPSGCNFPDQEYLLFDFSVQVGDTSYICMLTQYWPADVLREITQDAMFGEIRNVYHYAMANAPLIEGIGSGAGLMEPTIMYTGSEYYFLFDYCRGTDEECGVLFTNVDENYLKNDFSIFPNPASNLIRIQVNENRMNSFERKLTVSDVYGRCVREVNSSAEELSIDISDLSEGMYLITLKEGEKAITSRKLFIAR